MSVAERRARDFARRESELLAAARDLFANPGWEAVTIEQVAARAEIGKGTVYKHFASKDELFARIAMDAQRRVADAMKAAGAGEDAPLAAAGAAIRAGLTAAAALDLCDRQVAQYAGRADFRARLRPETRWAWEALDHDLEEALRAPLRDGVAAGLVAGERLHLYSLGAMAALKGALDLALKGDLPAGQADDRIAALARYMLAGVVGKKGRKALRDKD